MLKTLQLITKCLNVIRLVDHLEKCGLSTADLLKVVIERTVRSFNRSEGTQTVELETQGFQHSKVFILPHRRLE